MAIAAARQLWAEDTLVSYEKAAARLQDALTIDPNAHEARALAVEAHLAANLSGSASHLRSAEQLLAELDAAHFAGPESVKAHALRLLAAHKPTEAIAQLKPLAAQDPDAAILLGWCELALDDGPAALAAFRQALGLDAKRAAAHFGAARALEQLSDTAAAASEFRVAGQLSPRHLGAALGVIRLSEADSAELERKVLGLISQLGATASPIELGAAWTLLGTRILAERPAEAEERLRKAVALDSTAVEPRIGLAQLLCARDHSELALPFLEAVLARQPHSPEALVLMVEAQVNAKRADLAEDFLRRAAELRPKDARVAYWRGRLEELKGGAGASERAIAAYETAIAANPHLLDAYVVLSQLYQTAQPERAAATLAKAEEQVAAEPEQRSRLGRVYLSFGDGQKAETSFRRAVTELKDPSQLQNARLGLAQALELQGRFDEADALLRELETAGADALLIGPRRAALALARHDLEGAAKLYEPLVTQATASPALLTGAGEVNFRLHRYEVAFALYQRAVAADGRSVDALTGRAQAQLALHHETEALQDARRALALGDVPLAHLVAGRASEALGRPIDAQKEYQAAERSSTETDARIGEARLLIADGRVQDALASLERAAKKSPDRADLQLVIGDCLEELSRHGEAEQAYRAAVRLDPESGEAAFKLGRVLRDQGQRRAAAEMAERAIALGGDQASFAVAAYLLAGDARRESNDRARAVRAYQKYLELAPPDAPQRHDVQQALVNLEGHRR